MDAVLSENELNGLNHGAGCCPLGYLLYSCLTKPVASTSRTKLASTNCRGSALAAFGSRGD